MLRSGRRGPSAEPPASPARSPAGPLQWDALIERVRCAGVLPSDSVTAVLAEHATVPEIGELGDPSTSDERIAEITKSIRGRTARPASDAGAARVAARGLRHE